MDNLGKQLRGRCEIEENEIEMAGVCSEWFIKVVGEWKWQKRTCIWYKGDQGSWGAVKWRSNCLCTEKVWFKVSWTHTCTIIILQQKANKNLFWVILYFVLFYNFLSKYLYVTYFNTNIWQNIHSYSQNKYCLSVSSTWS